MTTDITEKCEVFKLRLEHLEAMERKQQKRIRKHFEVTDLTLHIPFHFVIPEQYEMAGHYKAIGVLKRRKGEAEVIFVDRFTDGQPKQVMSVTWCELEEQGIVYEA